jgi:hypothetical protein
VDTRGLSSERKGVGVEDYEIEGPKTPQDVHGKVEIVKVFKPGVNFMSIPVTHEIGAARSVRTYYICLMTRTNLLTVQLSPITPNFISMLFSSILRHLMTQGNSN